MPKFLVEIDNVVLLKCQRDACLGEFNFRATSTKPITTVRLKKLLETGRTGSGFRVQKEKLKITRLPDDYKVVLPKKSKVKKTISQSEFLKDSQNVFPNQCPH